MNRRPAIAQSSAAPNAAASIVWNMSARLMIRMRIMGMVKSVRLPLLPLFVESWISEARLMRRLATDGDAHHNYVEPKTFADYVRPEYRGTPQPFYKQG